MDSTTRTIFTLLEKDTRRGCACCTTQSADTSTAHTPMRESPMTEQTFAMTGLTCGHCVAAVSSEVAALPGVTAVTVSLAAGGVSTLHVAADSALSPSQVAGALDEAGDYHLATP